MSNHLNYVEIRMYEGERRGWFGPLRYQRLVADMWDRGVSGVTVIRAEAGFDSRGKIQNIHSDYISDNLPVIIECVVSDGELQAIERLRQELPRGQPVWKTDRAEDAKLLDAEVDGVAECGMLKVYMKESDTAQGEPLHEALLGRLGQMGVTWVSVVTALEGFGREQVMRRNRNFSLANQAPVVLEAVITSPTRVKDVLTAVKPLLARASGPAIFIAGETL